MSWYKENPGRLEREIRLISRNHPNARVFIKSGILTVFLKVIGKKSEYLIKIIYPEDFPFDQPKAFVLKPRLPNLYHEIHRFSDGSLCLIPPEEAGPQISGKMICDWACDWVRGYEIWLDTGRFPDEL